MAAMVSRHSLLVSISILIVVVVVNCLGKKEGELKGQVVEDVRQVACQYPATDVIQLQVVEVANTSRTVVASTRRGSCHGNLTFYNCLFNATVVQVTAIITDLHQGELRTFTCLVLLEKATDTETTIIGNVTVTKLGPTSENKPANKQRTNGHHQHVNNSHTNHASTQCPGDWTSTLTVLIVLLVISGIVTLILFAAYCREINKVSAASDRNVEVKDIKVQRVKSARLALPVVQAPDDAGRVMQYPIPDYSMSGVTLAQATDGAGQSEGLLQYQEPWGQLDHDLSDRLATLRPNLRMCLVPGFHRPADVTEKYQDEKDDNE